MQRRVLLLVLLTILCVGCATTLANPTTGQTRTCQSGGWIGFGLIGAPIAIIGNLIEIPFYRKCVNAAKDAGYTVEIPPDDSPPPIPPTGAVQPTNP